MNDDIRKYTRLQATGLIVLQLFIGWHFLYEGVAKLLNPYWTSAGYLSESKWWFSGLFIRLAGNATTLTFVDWLNTWGLIAIGAALMLGFLTRYAAGAGIVLLLLYWIAAPPFVGYDYAMPTEGSYLVVNKVLIEAAALLVLLAFPTRQFFGLDRLFTWKRKVAPAKLEQAHA